MNAMKRSEAVKSFGLDDEGSPRFIICSLHAAGTGINLTRANCAFMMDCWWNQAVENQASKFLSLTLLHLEIFLSSNQSLTI
jgi:SNF2 family DNA or RNA helicase